MAERYESRFSTTAVNLLHAIYQGISRCLHYANFLVIRDLKHYLDCSLSIGALEIAKKKCSNSLKALLQRMKLVFQGLETYLSVSYFTYTLSC